MTLVKSIFTAVMFTAVFYMASYLILAMTGMHTFGEWFYSELGAVIFALMVVIEVLLIKL